jgi:hypothetical protein
LSEIAGEAVCTGLFCAEAGIKVIADVTTSKININIESGGIMRS